MSRTGHAIVLALILVVISASAVSAVKNDEYKIVPANEKTPSTAITVLDSVRQGESDTHNIYIGSGVNWLEVNLDWTSSTDSLALTIYTPQWGNLGTFHDNDDGITDGKIHLDVVPNQGYVESGTWHFTVYGEQVASQRYYNLNVYQH